MVSVVLTRETFLKQCLGQKLSFTAAGRAELGALWKTGRRQCLTKLYTVFPHGPAVMLLGMYPVELRMCVHTRNLHSFIHNCPKLEATRKSFRRRVDK